MDEEVIRTLIEYTLAGGGGLALLRFLRDKRKDKNEADGVAITNSNSAVEILRDVAAELRAQLESEQKRNEKLTQALDRANERNSSLEHDLIEVTKKAADAAALAEVNGQQIVQLTSEIARLRTTYNIVDPDILGEQNS